MVSAGPNKGFIFRLLDSTDRTADCMALGILLGFMCFTSLIAIYGFVFLVHSFCPGRVVLDSGSYAAAVAGLSGAYSAVLGATVAAYRWRTPAGEEKKDA